MSEVLEKQEKITLSSELKTHKNIQSNHSYKILTLDEGYARVKISSKHSEKVDNQNLVYDGSIFSAANFCAMAAINEKEIFLIGANVDFLNPVSGEDEEVIFEAKAISNISGKKNVQVVGKVNDITIFQGDFVAIKLDNQSLIKANIKA
jgi:acyl-CoA thioesterase